MGDKISSKKIAIEANVPIIPGVDYAIKAADKPPNAVRETVENMRREANKRGFEVFGRIKLRDKKTGKIYR